MCRMCNPKGTECEDCSTMVTPNDDYMVNDALWLDAYGSSDGNLCLECFEKRLGREITVYDVQFVPQNVYINAKTSALIHEKYDSDRIFEAVTKFTVSAKRLSYIENLREEFETQNQPI